MAKFYHIKTGEIVETRFYKDMTSIGGVARVSEICHLLPKPILEKWKYEQLFEAVHNGGATTVEAAIEQMELTGKIAADAGTSIHSICEALSTGAAIPKVDNLTPELIQAVKDNYAAWMREMKQIGYEDTNSEEVLINRKEGYAGRCDRQMARTQGTLFVDFKSQDCKVKKKGGLDYTAYPEWCFQLAAYASAKNQLSRADKIPADIALMSVIIDRNSGQFISHWWDNDEANHGWRTFVCFRDAYYHTHKIYDEIAELLKKQQC